MTLQAQPGSGGVGVKTFGSGVLDLLRQLRLETRRLQRPTQPSQLFLEGLSLSGMGRGDGGWHCPLQVWHQCHLPGTGGRAWTCQAGHHRAHWAFGDGVGSAVCVFGSEPGWGWPGHRYASCLSCILRTPPPSCSVQALMSICTPVPALFPHKCPHQPSPGPQDTA